MKKILTTLLLIPSLAFGWSPEDANKAINQTNFIVDDRCSGTLVSLDPHLILTNYHCVDHKVRSQMQEVVKDGEITEVKQERLYDVPVSQNSYRRYELVGKAEYQTEIVAKEKGKDLALLEIKADDTPHTIFSPIPAKDRNVVRGETAYAVGNPRMLDATITKDIVSSTTRTMRPPWANNDKIPFLQYDGGAAPGSSGGALYDDNGFLIGVPAAGVSDTLVFAIHTDLIREFLDTSCYPIYLNGELGEQCADWGELGFSEDEE